MIVQLDLKGVIALIGAMTLVLGVFLPSITTPLFGNHNYLDVATIGGASVLVLAALSLGMIFAGRVRFAGMPGALALVFIGHDYLSLQSNIADSQAELVTRPEAAALGEFASVFQVVPSYGWVVLGLGALTLIAASWLRLRQPLSA